MRRIECNTHSAYVVLGRKREHVATVTLQFPRDGAGRVVANVRNITDEAQRRSAGRYLATYGALPKGDGASESGAHLWLQSGTASGYGYDKATAALSGLIVDGHTLADHCGRVPEAEKARARLFHRYVQVMAHDRQRSGPTEWKREDTETIQKAFDVKARKLGARFANWSREHGRYDSLHFRAGLDRLEYMGYTVIGAL